MGSEFAYEDLSSFEIEKFTYKFIRDERVNDIDCYLVEQYPVDKNSGYKRRQIWINKQEYRPEKIDFYDRKNSPLKTLTYDGYKQYLDKYWRPDVMMMVNHQTGKSTRLTWKNYRFDTGLSKKDFNKNSLKRAR